MHEASKDYLMMLLTMYAEKGEKETFRYLKRDLKEDISGYDRISPFEKTGPVAIGQNFMYVLLETLTYFMYNNL